MTSETKRTTPPPKPKKRCALIGVGNRAHSWLSGIVEQHPEAVELVGLCDLNPERCRDVNAAYGTTAAVDDNYDRLLAEVKPDLVIVVSPESCHREHIVKALDAGCHVATEKPLCATIERCLTCAHAGQCEWYTDVSVKDRSEELSRELGYRVKGVREYIRDYCPFANDVDIYDTMAVQVGYRNGGLLNYSLNAAVPFEGWNLAINGTKGRLESKITDAKPAAPWIPAEWRRQYLGREVEWPNEYRIFVMPHQKAAFEVTVPNIAEGHGGGDCKIFDAALADIYPPQDTLNLFASAIHGARSTAIGAGANASIASGQAVHLKDWSN